MQASRVSFFAETRMKLDNPVLDFMKKRNLKIERVKEFIREQPAGTKLKFEDVIGAAGYMTNDTKSYGAGYAFVRGLWKSGIIEIEDTVKHLKLFTIPSDAINKVEELPVETTPEPGDEVVVEDKQEEQEQAHVTFTRLEYQVVDVEEVRRIENLAREFSWSNDSDSLREFIKSLK